MEISRVYTQDRHMGGRRPRGGFQRVYDALAILFLIWPATGASWLLASTRGWGYSIGLAVGFIGAALCLLRPLFFRRTPAWALPPAFWCFAAVALYVCLRVPFAASPYDAGWEALRWVCLLMAYLAWVQVGRERGSWRWLLVLLICSAMLEGIYALYQELNHSNLVLWLPRPEQYGMRASGTYLCPNHFANLLTMVFPVALVLLCMPAAGFPLRILGAYYLIITTPAVYLSQSRSAWLGVLAGILVIPLVLAWQKSRKFFFMALLVLPLVAAAAAWVAWESLPMVQSRFDGLFEDPDRVSAGRLNMWRDAPAMFKAAPLLGHGPNSYVWAYPPFRHHTKANLLWDYPHNEYIQFLLEHGLAGFLLLVLAVAVFGVRLLRAAADSREVSGVLLLAGMAGAVTVNLVHAFFDFNFHIFPNPHALVLLVGVGWGAWLALEQGGGDPEEPGWRLWLFRGGALALGGLCLAGLAGSITRGMSYWWHLKGEIAVHAVDYAAAGEAFQKAIGWRPDNPAALLGLGDLYMVQATWFVAPTSEERQQGKRGLAARAAEYYDKATARNPYEMKAVYGEGRALDMAGDPEGALERLRHAAAFQPKHPFYREQVGLQLRRMKRYEEALAVFEQNIEDKTYTRISTANRTSLKRRLAAAQAAPPDPASP